MLVLDVIKDTEGEKRKGEQKVRGASALQCGVINRLSAPVLILTIKRGEQGKKKKRQDSEGETAL